MEGKKKEKREGKSIPSLSGFGHHPFEIT